MGKVEVYRNPASQGKACSSRTNIAARDYRSYQMRWWEKIKYAALYIGIAGIAAELFYHQLYLIIPAGLLLPLWFRYKSSYLAEERRRKLRLQYRDSLRCVAGALNAGYSIENAYRETYRDMVQLYGSQAIMCQELRDINARMELNEPIDKLLLDFAYRSGIEEAVSFGQVFQFAKRMGGNQVAIIQNTCDQIGERITVSEEIAVMLAAKKMEQKVMSVTPLVILTYIQSSAPEFISVLYGNVAGVIVMTLALGVYLVAIALGERIMKIEV